MQRISFAPVLSATRSRDSCWITSLLLCPSHFVRPQLPRRADARLSACSARASSLRSRGCGLSAQSGPAVHGTRPVPGPGTWAPAQTGWDLLRLLDDLDQSPPLGGRQRPGLHDLHAVADAGDPLLVMHLELRRTADDLGVQRVLHAVLDLYDDGLLHLVAHHEALADLAVAATGQAGPGRLLALGHATPSFGATDRPSSRSRMIV